MELNAPLAGLAELTDILEAGADAFYCGLVDPGDAVDLATANRRASRNANFGSVEELAEAVARAHDAGRRVFLTMNEHFYGPTALPRMEERLRMAAQIGLDAVIVSNLGLLRIARRHLAPSRLCASVGLVATNQATVAFLHRLGVGRVILPRHLTMDEVAVLARAQPDVEFEVFAKNSRCGNYDGLCGYFHNCVDGIAYETACARVEDPRAMKLRPRACGLCDLFELRTLGNVRLAKVVGRELPRPGILRDVRFVRKALDLMRGTANREDYALAVKHAYEGIYGHPCDGDCYYHSGG